MPQSGTALGCVIYAPAQSPAPVRPSLRSWRRDIQMGAGPDPAVHHRQQHATLVQRLDHVIAGNAGAVRLEEDEVGFGSCTSMPLICESPRASARALA